MNEVIIDQHVFIFNFLVRSKRARCHTVSITLFGMFSVQHI